MSLVDLFHIPYTVELEESENIPCEIMHDESRPNVERYVTLEYSVIGRVSDFF